MSFLFVVCTFLFVSLVLFKTISSKKSLNLIRITMKGRQVVISICVGIACEEDPGQMTKKQDHDHSSSKTCHGASHCVLAVFCDNYVPNTVSLSLNIILFGDTLWFNLKIRKRGKDYQLSPSLHSVIY